MLLGAHNLNPGEELIGVIKSVEGGVTIKGPHGEDKGVSLIHFKNVNVPMILSPSRACVIGSLYGGVYDTWAGKSIQIYVVESKKSDTGIALRIREAIPVNDDDKDLPGYKDALLNCENTDELKEVFMAIPRHLQAKLVDVKDKAKKDLCEL